MGRAPGAHPSNKHLNIHLISSLVIKVEIDLYFFKWKREEVKIRPVLRRLVGRQKIVKYLPSWTKTALRP